VFGFSFQKYRWEGEEGERGVETRVIMGVCTRGGAATRCGALSESGDADDIGECTRWPARWASLQRWPSLPDRRQRDKTGGGGWKGREKRKEQNERGMRRFPEGEFSSKKNLVYTTTVQEKTAQYSSETLAPASS
jgi:hypothetical protein